MIRIRPYKAHHLAQIEPREYEREMRDKAGLHNALLLTKGPAYTIYDDRTPVMAGGIVKLWGGVGEVWLYLSPWFETHHKTAYKAIKQCWSDALKTNYFTRIQTPVCAALPANVRLIEHFGFSWEGTMRKWGPEGHDYHIMALVSDNGERICSLDC